METHIVIMAGGIGSRFWPMSTPECPKQFIDVTGCGKSLIQLTVERFQGLCIPDNIWIVTSDKYKETVRKQLPSVPPHHILTEPVARNTYNPQIEMFARFKMKSSFHKTKRII